MDAPHRRRMGAHHQPPRSVLSYSQGGAASHWTQPSIQLCLRQPEGAYGAPPLDLINVSKELTAP